MTQQEKILTGVREHYSKFFAGHECSYWDWTLGPIGELAPWFQVARFAPGPKTSLWTYASVGAALLSEEGSKRIEFIILTENETSRPIELLSMIAHYHHDYSLNMFHSLPIGQPWLDGATCDQLLVSLPYPFGEELEICCLKDEHIQVLWLLPITQKEAEFKKSYGVDALEEKFDDAEIEYWKTDRKSVV